MSTSQTNSPSFSKTIPDIILYDLYLRFLNPVPFNEQHNTIRLMFRMELAHWFYIDNYCTTDNSLPKVGLKPFSNLFCKSFDIFSNCSSNIAINKMNNYKRKILVCGLVMLDSDYENVLLVKNICGRSWCFPKGKINQNETPVACALREALEETGYDASKNIKKIKFTVKWKSQPLEALYMIATDIPRLHNFKPIVINEIESVMWFNIERILNHGIRENETEIFRPEVFLILKNIKELLSDPFCKIKLLYKNIKIKSDINSLTVKEISNNIKSINETTNYNIDISIDESKDKIKFYDDFEVPERLKKRKHTLLNKKTETSEFYNNEKLINYHSDDLYYYIKYKSRKEEEPETNIVHNNIIFSFYKAFSSWRYLGQNPFIFN